MGRKRRMPSRAKIFEYWKDKLDKAVNDNTCFKCGATSVLGDSIVVDRAHILAVCEGGSDDVDNLHLLCKNCHRESEPYIDKEYQLWMTSKNKEEFCKSLFILWNRSDIKNESLNKYFSKVKEDYISNLSELMFDYQIHNYEEECKEHLEKYYKSLS